ncbi:alpha/beta fold hydrolase [Rheinheimera baltica]|uniref:YqiA/YcfP family alpha/beta fold hydrolase n=1 Tax=Rheinheimera baltica TaxID=67576 RepID=UPI00273DA260|nr:YqiA/YcfP family alpha/beta fold hydrolase [Rheinheimera baltica]MDP5142154.1 alpha/beta fold hydrolase [Rheinheimera baltica]
MNKKVVYLHGFASSSQSEKAQLTTAFFARYYSHIDFTALDLPYEPTSALALIKHHIGARRDVALIGSSLGGFLATCIAEQIQCRACLINPAVAPHKVLDKHLGRYFHPVLQQHYDVTPAQMTVLAQLMPPQLLQPENYLLMLQSGDEVLDYRQALSYYRGAKIKLSEGGDHSYVGYTNELDAIANFCQLA